MKYALSILVLLVFSAPMRADTTTDYTFSFSGPGGLSGDGSFTTIPYDDFPGGSVITSLTGEMDGQPMVLDCTVPICGGLNDAGQFSGYPQDQLQFTVDGAVYAIWEGEFDPYTGYDLWVGGTAFPSEIIPIQWSMADPAPTDTPEPGMLALCGIGLLAVAAGFLARRVAVGR